MLSVNKYWKLKYLQLKCVGIMKRFKTDIIRDSFSGKHLESVARGLKNAFISFSKKMAKLMKKRSADNLLTT